MREDCFHDRVRAALASHGRKQVVLVYSAGAKSKRTAAGALSEVGGDVLVVMVEPTKGSNGAAVKTTPFEIWC